MPICFTRPIRHGPYTRRCQPLRPRGIPPKTYNTRNGRGFSLAQAIWAVHLGSFDVMLLNETKISGK